MFFLKKKSLSFKQGNKSAVINFSFANYVLDIAVYHSRPEYFFNVVRFHLIDIFLRLLLIFFKITLVSAGYFAFAKFPPVI